MLHHCIIQFAHSRNSPDNIAEHIHVPVTDDVIELLLAMQSYKNVIRIYHSVKD
jgi:hypothetical protein